MAVGRSAHAGLPLGRGHPEAFLEAGREILGRLHSHLVCHLGSSHGPGRQQLGCTTEPQLAQVLIGRLAGERLELGEKGRTAHAHAVGKAVGRKLCVGNVGLGVSHYLLFQPMVALVGHHFRCRLPGRGRPLPTSVGPACHAALHQPPALGHQQPKAERLGHIGIGTHIVALCLRAHIAEGRKQYHRQPPCAAA